MDVVLIPMKPLAAAKERLAPALSGDERRRLSLAMLADVIAAAQGFDRVWVLNSDDDASELSRASGVEAVHDPAPGAGLNASLEAATRAAVGEGATGVLVVSADLPGVAAADLVALVASPGVALAPDRAGTGTNALWRAPGDLIDVAFGPNSLAAHAESARAAGMPALVVARPGLALDVDTPDDLAEAWRHGVGPATRKALEELGIAARLRLAG
jgi:2-phospho-L-lactate/phosphoenolpyruvate guanylyltransferase